MQRCAMRRCLKGLGGRPTSTDGFILGPVTRHSGSALLLRATAFHADRSRASAKRGLYEVEASLPFSLRLVNLSVVTQFGFRAEPVEREILRYA